MQDPPSAWNRSLPGLPHDSFESSEEEKGRREEMDIPVRCMGVPLEGLRCCIGNERFYFSAAL